MSGLLQWQEVLLADGYDPHDVTLLACAVRAVTELVNEQVAFELIASNIDRPDAEKYGTFSDGSPRHAPEWYTAQGIKTGVHDGLYGRLKQVLSCPSVDEHGHVCIGSIGHETGHWDGDGCNWASPEGEQT